MLRGSLAITQERQPVPEAPPRVTCNITNEVVNCEASSWAIESSTAVLYRVDSNSSPELSSSDFTLSTTYSSVSRASPPISCSSRRNLDPIRSWLPQRISHPQVCMEVVLEASGSQLLGDYHCFEGLYLNSQGNQISPESRPSPARLEASALIT